MDRSFVISFGVSLACHFVLVGVTLFDAYRTTYVRSHRALEVIYEYEIAEREVRRLKRQLAALRGEGLSAPAIASPSPQIRIPDRPLSELSRSLQDFGASRAAVIDLTNVVDAARGDPVLLSYFSAIREQIQQTANRRQWLSGEGSEGLVYVAFVMLNTGRIHSVTILADRSVASRDLRDISLKIINASAPFPPFPPSIKDPSKTIVVPLEFLVGS